MKTCILIYTLLYHLMLNWSPDDTFTSWTIAENPSNGDISENPIQMSPCKKQSQLLYDEYGCQDKIQNGYRVNNFRFEKMGLFVHLWINHEYCPYEYSIEYNEPMMISCY